MDLHSAIDSFTRAYLALFFTGVAVFYTTLIIYKKRRFAHEMVFPGQRYSCTWWNHMLFRFFRATIWMVCLARWPYPQLDEYIGVFFFLYSWPVLLIGNSLLTLGFLLAVTAHFNLGKHWYSGIDPEGPESLITNGLFHYSRNPMFVSVAIAQLGFFLALPSLFSFICWMIGWTTLYLQAVAEEQHLLNKFKASYRKYQAQVPRWL